MHRYFICDRNEIENELKSLTLINTTDDGWTENYKNEITNEEWQLVLYRAEYHGGGTPVFKRLPELNLGKLIDTARTSNSTSDILGASLEISER